MKYLAVYDNTVHEGRTLEEAHANLCDDLSDINFDEITFYEAEEIEVEMKIIKKPIVVKVKKESLPK